MSGGVSTLIFGVRMLLEVRGDFVVVKLDMSNGFNAVSRSVLLRRLGEVPALAHWVPFLHALSGPGSDLLLGRLAMRLFEGELRADSSEGTQQGLPPSSMAFSVAIQPELVALDAELAAMGGAARAITDDVFLMYSRGERLLGGTERARATVLGSEYEQAVRSFKRTVADMEKAKARMEDLKARKEATERLARERLRERRQRPRQGRRWGPQCSSQGRLQCMRRLVWALQGSKRQNGAVQSEPCTCTLRVVFMYVCVCVYVCTTPPLLSLTALPTRPWARTG